MPSTATPRPAGSWASRPPASSPSPCTCASAPTRRGVPMRSPAADRQGRLRPGLGHLRTASPPSTACSPEHRLAALRPTPSWPSCTPTSARPLSQSKHHEAGLTERMSILDRHFGDTWRTRAGLRCPWPTWPMTTFSTPSPACSPPAASTRAGPSPCGLVPPGCSGPPDGYLVLSRRSGLYKPGRSDRTTRRSAR